MKPADILRTRLSSQRIVTKAPALKPAEVVHHFLGLQAQDFGQAVWAVGVRSPGATRAGVLDSMARGEIVRSWPLRGTLMFLPAEDLGWMLALTGQRLIQGSAARHRQLEIDDGVVAKASKVAERLLDGSPSTRDEFFAALNAAGIETTGQRGVHIIWMLALTGVVCWGPPKGTQQGLVLLDEWVPAPRKLDRDESLRELALRYFTSHGPATLKDLAWWAQLTVKDATAGLEACRDRLSEVDGAFMATSELEQVPATMTSALIALPGFDEYILGYQDRAHPLAAEHFERIVPGGNGIFLPMIVSKGRVIGTWRRDKKVIRPEFFGASADFSKAEKAYAKFMA